MLLIILIAGGCSPKVDTKPLVISTDTWVGASLLYYAHYQGWLEEENMQMLQANSINENMRVFESGASDAFTGTQHEYKQQLRKYPDLIPIVVYDRSYGGDIIMSNRTKEELHNSDQPISVYFESDSVSEELLEYFVEYNQIDRSRLIMNHRTPSELTSLKSRVQDNIIIVTYSPYDLKLSQNGFTKVASSKEDGYYVIDAIYVRNTILQSRYEEIKGLKKILERSLAAYHKNPKAFYEVVKLYLENPTYEEFKKMCQNIKWMDDAMEPKIMVWMDKIDFPKEHLLK